MKKYIPYVIVAVAIIVSGLFVGRACAVELETLYLDARSPQVELESLGDSITYKDPTVSLNVRATVIELSAFSVGVQASATSGIEMVEWETTSHNEGVFGRLAVKGVGVEPYVNHSGLGNEDLGWSAGVRVGYGLGARR